VIADFRDTTPGLHPTVHRFFVRPENIHGARADLPSGTAAQIARVLKLRRGEQVALFDGAGREWTATLEEVSESAVSGQLVEERRPDVELPCAITICQALIKPERFETVLQKGTELGASRFVPLVTNRVQGADSAGPSPARLARWQRIVQEAAEQSGRVRIPEITVATRMGETVPAEARRGPVVLLWEQERGASLRSVLRSVMQAGAPERLSLIVGPVGGLEAAEVGAAKNAGARVAGIGRRVLRSETAAVAALAAVLYEFGYLGDTPAR
jgi:16S rRNA (uracil1498-N3)-methyltransferase